MDSHQPDEEHRTIGLENRVLRYRDWSLALDELALIGEYTTPNGPYAEDWFVVFVTHSGEWFDLSMSASGLESILTELKYQDIRPAFRLGNSTKFASSIAWPPSKAGHPLFEFRPHPPTTLRDKIERFFGIYHKIDLVLQAELVPSYYVTEPKVQHA